MSSHAKLKKQAGAAAIEFALSISLFFLLFFGLVSFGTLFWFQQKLSYAAGEGTRMAFQEVLLQQSLVPQQAAWLHDNGTGPLCQHALQQTDYLKSHTTCQTRLHSCQSMTAAPINGNSSPLQRCNFSLILRYDTSHNPLIHSANWVLAMFQEDSSTTGDKSMPIRIAAQSTVQIQTRSDETNP